LTLTFCSLIEGGRPEQKKKGESGKKPRKWVNCLGTTTPRLQRQERPLNEGRAKGREITVLGNFKTGKTAAASFLEKARCWGAKANRKNPKKTKTGGLEG